jgi:hypothetical protein
MRLALAAIPRPVVEAETGHVGCQRIAHRPQTGLYLSPADTMKEV